MYRLKVIAGPSNAQPVRGVSYGLDSGEVSIGRHSENQIVLNSGSVSKKHCVLVVSNGSVVVRDQGSANGTFVNGQLTQKKSIRPGDRIAVGDFIFELKEGASRAKAPSVGSPANVVPFPVHSGLPASETAFMATPASGRISSGATPLSEPVPTSPLGRLRYSFEKFVMPYFYGLNERYDWKLLGIGFIAAFIILNLVISISPLMEAQENAITRELTTRAQLIAREISERNTPFFAAKQETRSELGSIGKGEAVKVAVILDLTGKIIAPASNAGELFTRGVEAVYAQKAVPLFASGRETEIAAKPDLSTVVAIAPIKVLNPRLGKNEVVAMTLVSVDTEKASPGLGELSAVYANAFILSLLIGLLIFFVLYKVTIRPLDLLNQQIDEAIRGERHELKSPVVFEEMDPLWTIADSVIKRLPKSDPTFGMGGGGFTPSVQDFLPQFQALGGGQSNLALAVLDGNQQVAYLNPSFEEITGIRGENAQGQSLESVSRDQAFTALIQDVLLRAQPGGEGAIEDFEFSGVSYKVQAFGFGSPGVVACYLVTLARTEVG